MNQISMLYVLTQIVIIVAIVLCAYFHSVVLFSAHIQQLFFSVGSLILIFGLLVSGYSAFYLGKLLTPLPTPKKEHFLIITGPYSFVRHPIYFGLILSSIGMFLISCDLGVAILDAFLISLLFYKSKFEEKLLCQRYDNYYRYQQNVKRLIPYFF